MYHESSEERLVDGKDGLAYRMDRNQMNVDRPWEKNFFYNIFFLMVSYFWLT